MRKVYNFIRGFVAPIWYRFFGYKHHIIRTGLKPCQWIDTDTRMLYAVMSLVEWFVENDMRYLSREECDKEIDRIKQEDPNDEMGQIEMIVNQMRQDQETIEIYNWWKDYHRKMKNISDARVKYSEYVDSFQEDDDFLSFCNHDNMNEEQKSEAKRLLDVLSGLEEDLRGEETTYLKKAIDCRENMWS